MESLTNALIGLLTCPEIMSLRYDYSGSGFLSEVNPRDGNIQAKGAGVPMKKLSEMKSAQRGLLG